MNSIDKKLVNTKSGLKIMISDLNTSPFYIQEPRWIPDKECKYCVKCQKKFDPLKRKHHCRRCGRIFCNDCCHSKRPLPRMCFVDPVRHCVDCAPRTDLENRFFLQQLHTLTAGASFLLEMSDLESQVCICTLSTDNRSIICDIFDEEQSIENVTLDSIIDYEMMFTEYSGAMLTFLSADGTTKRMQLKVDGTSRLKTSSFQWIAALHEGLTYLHKK